MTDEFKSFAQDALRLKKINKCLLAVSGGIDSVVMAELFSQAGFPFAIVHCNFKLRGDDSDQDEQFVRELAQKYEVACMVKTFDTEKYAGTEGISIQMAARDLRYTWFNQLLREGHGQEIATAHHKNDVLETMLLNLTKGTGLAGMHGILPRKGHVIRPLLFADKNQIQNYAQEHQLKWREDSSNEEDKYQRNLIRHQVVPILQEINPALLKTMDHTLERFIGAEALVRASCQQIEQKCLVQRGQDAFLQLEKILPLPGLHVIMHEVLSKYGFQYQQSREIAKILKEKPKDLYVGKVFDSKTHRANLDRKELVITPLAIPSQAVASEISEKEHVKELDQFEINMRVLDAERYNIMPLANVAALDHEKLKFPLKLRKWKKGDAFYPLGMNCKKKLSDFMVDTKIPLNLKDRVFVLTSGDDIVWVVGHRIDHRYRVTDHTRQVYEVTQQVRI